MKTLTKDWAKHFRTLEKGWDSYGGVPIEELAITLAQILTEEPPSVVPCSDGGVQIEWHTHGFDIEIEIKPKGSMSIYNSIMYEEENS